MLEQPQLISSPIIMAKPTNTIKVNNINIEKIELAFNLTPKINSTPTTISNQGKIIATKLSENSGIIAYFAISAANWSVIPILLAPKDRKINPTTSRKINNNIGLLRYFIIFFLILTYYKTIISRKYFKIMPIISSISGLRVTEDILTPELIKNYINALALYLKSGKVAVGRDGRPSGEFIENIVRQTLSELGFESIILGIIPTPTVQLAVERFNCVAGIAITASHNPEEWNGLKFINSEGTFFNADENKKLWSFLDREYIPKNENAYSHVCKDMIDYHINQVLNLSITNPFVDKIKKRKFKIAVDAVNASGSVIVPKLLEQLDCEVHKLYCENNGIFPHTPEPLPQNLTSLANYVNENKLDIGIAVDPDADRLVLIDENGENIGEEMTICLAIDSVFSSIEGNAVVNLSTTAVTELIARSYNSKVYRAPVGEINVVNKMKELSAVVGGEGSGGVILPESHFGRDSLVGIILTLKILAEKGLSLRQLVDSYPKKVMIKTKQSFSGDFSAIEVLLKSLYKNEKVNTKDGIRIDFPNRWVQIRKSNTEPIIRIIAEADNENIANELIKIVSELVN